MTELPATATIDRLIAEALEIIPSLTSSRGSYRWPPQAGYTGRSPGEWQQEVLETIDKRYLTAFKPDTNDILTLVELVNYWTLAHPTAATFPRHDGVCILTPVSTLATIVGYALFEMLVRKLGPGRRGKSSFAALLRQLERVSSHTDLTRDLKSLNTTMTYQKAGKRIDLYERLKDGRDELVHGNVLRTTEPEGWLLVLLMDLVVLHVMRQQIRKHNAASS